MKKWLVIMVAAILLLGLMGFSNLPVIGPDPVFACGCALGGGAPGGELAKRIDDAFGNFESFKEKFKTAGVTQFGSGWAWLALDGDTLKVTKTANASNPLVDGMIPILGIDVWEVIEAAATKPFGFMPFYPGPGIGGACIPVSPAYLAWRAADAGSDTPIINLARSSNDAVPSLLAARMAAELAARNGSALAETGQPLTGQRILLMGIAYKRDVEDTRRSPALILLDELEKLGAEVLTGWQVTDLGPGTATLSNGDSQQVLATAATVWAAGVKASPLSAAMESYGAELDPAGRIIVSPDLTVPGHPNATSIMRLTRMARFAPKRPSTTTYMAWIGTSAS